MGRGMMHTIYLTGFMGTGKSTVARLLAARLGVPSLDLDAAIVERAGRPIADIFARDGESAFRTLESHALSLLTVDARERGAVIATGGGVPVAEANRQMMFENGWVICLDARPETIHERIRAQLRTDGQAGVRPLLDEPDALGRIRALKSARQFAYSLAHWTIHTDQLSPEEVADEVVRAVNLLGGHRAAASAPSGGFRLGAKWFGRDRPLVCVPIVAATPEAVLDFAAQIAPLAPDAIELRADYLAELSPQMVARLLPQLAAQGLPILFTNRLAVEGGAREQDEVSRIEALVAAIETGVPAIVDVELATAAPWREQVLNAGKRRGVPILLSFHHFTITPPDEELLATVMAMDAVGADAAKLATMPQSVHDAVRLLVLTRLITGGEAGVKIPLAAMSMGPLGMITRISGHEVGSALTFAALASGSGSAPGQLAIAELRAIWAATSPNVSVP